MLIQTYMFCFILYPKFSHFCVIHDKNKILISMWQKINQKGNWEIPEKPGNLGKLLGNWEYGNKTGNGNIDISIIIINKTF